MNLFVGYRRFTLRQQLKMLWRAWFAFRVAHEKGGWHLCIRTPLCGLFIYKDFPSYPVEGTDRTIWFCFWPSLPLVDGGKIYRAELKYQF